MYEPCSHGHCLVYNICLPTVVYCLPYFLPRVPHSSPALFARGDVWNFVFPISYRAHARPPSPPPPSSLHLGSIYAPKPVLHCLHAQGSNPICHCVPCARRRSPPFSLCMLGHMFPIPRARYVAHSQGGQGRVREAGVAHLFAAQAPAPRAIKTALYSESPDRSPDRQI